MDQFTFNDILDQEPGTPHFDLQQPLTGEINGTVLTNTTDGSVYDAGNFEVYLTNDNGATWSRDSVEMVLGSTFVRVDTRAADGYFAKLILVVKITPTGNPEVTDTFEVICMDSPLIYSESREYVNCYAAQPAQLFDMERGTLVFQPTVGGVENTADRLGSLDRYSGSANKSDDYADHYYLYNNTDSAPPSGAPANFFGTWADYGDWINICDVELTDALYDPTGILAIEIINQGVIALVGELQFDLVAKEVYVEFTSAFPAFWTLPARTLVGSWTSETRFRFGMRAEITGGDVIISFYSTDISASPITTVTATSVSSSDLRGDNPTFIWRKGVLMGKGMRNYGLYTRTGVTEATFTDLVDQITTVWPTKETRLTNLMSTETEGFPSIRSVNRTATLVASGKFKDENGVTNSNKSYSLGMFVSNDGNSTAIIDAGEIVDGDVTFTARTTGMVFGSTGTIALFDVAGVLCHVAYNVLVNRNWPNLPTGVV